MDFDSDGPVITLQDVYSLCDIAEAANLCELVQCIVKIPDSGVMTTYFLIPKGGLDPKGRVDLCAHVNICRLPPKVTYTDRRA